MCSASHTSNTPPLRNTREHSSNSFWKGTPNGNDLTVGMFIWSDGSVGQLKKTILHNMAVAPRMDGELKAADVDAVAAYVWAISHQRAAPVTASP